MNFFNMNSNIKTNKFFETLESIKDETYNLYISGLLISDNEAVINECPYNFSMINIEKDITKQDFFNSLKQAFLNKDWICFNFKTNTIPSFVEEQLLRLARSNEVYLEELAFHEKLETNTRVFGIISKEDFNSINIDLNKCFRIFNQV